ncbi:MAG: integrase DNA-binding domain-containing protein [Erysipelotrichaceae bacterium]|nr:integrase DNA-binding domain-containing protein [Erysipelotrichaceae bacterium]
MAKRKDSKKRALKKGEGVRRTNGKESYYYRWSDATGKRHYIYSANLNDLRRQENQIVRDRMDNIKYAGNLKLNDVYYMWVKVRRGLKEITFSGYQYTYENYVYATLGQKKLNDLTKMNFRLFYIKLVEENNLNISTVENIHKVIHLIIDLAVEQDYLRKNISTGALKELKRTEECSEKKMALTKEQQKLFEECLLDKKNICYRPIFLVMLYAGLRVGEATGLRWCDIDFDKKEKNLICTVCVIKIKKH